MTTPRQRIKQDKKQPTDNGQKTIMSNSTTNETSEKAVITDRQKFITQDYEQDLTGLHSETRLTTNKMGNTQPRSASQSKQLQPESAKVRPQTILQDTGLATRKTSNIHNHKQQARADNYGQDQKDRDEDRDREAYLKSSSRLRNEGIFFGPPACV